MHRCVTAEYGHFDGVCFDQPSSRCRGRQALFWCRGRQAFFWCRGRQAFFLVLWGQAVLCVCVGKQSSGGGGVSKCKRTNLMGGVWCVGKEVSVVMEYNRQVPFGGAMAAEAAKAKNQTVEMRDMGFATVTIAEKDSSGQQRSNNVCQAPTLPSFCMLPTPPCCCL